MAGHSQFKNIMHRKGAQDKKRAKIFNRLSREIMVAAREGQPDPEFNPRLRTAIQNAKSNNMPKDRIERAVKQGTPGASDEVYEEVRYEGFGPGGVAVVVEALTENRNRTVAEVRSAFNKNGGTLGDAGAVSFMFDHLGYIRYPAETAAFDALFEAGAEAGAENVESDDSDHHIWTEADDMAAVRDALEARFGTASEARLAWRPQTTVAVEGDQAETLMRMIEALDDLDDVQRVEANFEIDDAILERLSA